MRLLLDSVGQRAEYRYEDEGEHCSSCETEDYRYGHGAPPLGGLTTDIPAKIPEVETDTGRHREESEDCGQSGEHNRAKTYETGLYESFTSLYSFLFELVVVSRTRL